MEIYRHDRKKHNSRGNRIQLAILTGICSISVFLGVYVLTNKKSVLSPLSAAHETPQPTPLPYKKPSQAELSKAIALAFDDSIVEYSLIVDDFKSDTHFELGDQTTYVGASILKVPILIHLYDEIAQKKISPDQSVTIETDDIQDYGTGTIRYEKPGTEFSVTDLAQKMIRESDNTAAYVLGRKVMQFTDIQSAVNQWGLTETDMEGNTTSNKDMNLLFRKLFFGELLPTEENRLVISLLTNSDYEDRLPALLPKKTKIFHKVGSTIGGIHDVGVVMGDNSLYYIGILTRGISDEERAIKAIARISKAVYDTMEGNN
jgi:beta-lactamase class A